MIKVISNLISKLGLMSNKMVPSPTTNLLDPPSQVRGMTKWQPELFKKLVVLPSRYQHGQDEGCYFTSQGKGW